MIAETALAFPEVHGDIRRCRLLAFPAYSINYRLLGEEVVILAVFHGRRKPSVWKARR